MASVGEDIDEYSAGAMSIYATDIMDTPISSNLSIPIITDNVYDEYKSSPMNLVGVPVDSTVTFDEFSDPNDSDKISDPRCAYFDCSDNESYSFDKEQYFDCIDNFSYSSDFNCK